MNITELDQYNLADAVKFHNRLNPKIWGRDEQLLPEVRAKLMEIAADFQEFLGLSDLDVQDITLSGSNAAYSYTPHSDIDLHLVVSVPGDEVYQELFNAKKYQYNDMHDIRIHGADVELYVQPADEAPVSLGEYSVLNNKWIEVPKRKRAKIDQTLVRHKYEDVKARIESALKDNDSDRIQSLISKIKEMRQAGLDAHGEFGPENLAFKMLRKQGWIKRLYEHVAAAKDRELSLKETEPKKPVKYGYGTDSSDYKSFFKPAAPKAPATNVDVRFNKPQDYEWYQQQQTKKQKFAAEDATETPDGVSATTCMFLNEEQDNEQIVHEFIEWAADKLGITELPEIYIHTDPEWSVDEHSFGRYEPDSHILHVNMANRHLFDILRTTAHELAHCKQNQAHPLPDDAGETGSEWENEAHAAAGIIMRDFADAHPELFATPALSESASGYIPTKKQAKDPRYSMALTVDIKPGQVGKEANKMALQTDKQGKPEMIYQSVNQIHESLSDQLSYEFSLLEEQYLGEIKMSPTNLRAEAAKTGAQAGMEFEMIVPGVGSVDDSETEPDFDYNESVSDIRDAVRFFDDGDYNGRRELQRLESSMREDYEEWAVEKFDEHWVDNAPEYVREYLEVNASDQDIVDILGLEGEEAQAILDNGASKHDYTAAADEVLGGQDNWYEDARSDSERDYLDNGDLESDWLNERGIHSMVDVMNDYDISWPYYTTGGDGEVNVGEVANDFSEAIGKPINASTSYHGARREAGHYVVEPDGSLEGDEDDDAGLEFVSPPMPIDEMISDLNKVKAWAKWRGCYTNKSTGLHINISVPNFSIEKLDYVKLALLLGDKYILDQYGRAGNTYTKSALGKVQDKVRSQPDTAKAMLDKMRSGMEQLASKAIHSGSTDKYTSINTKSGYIEFRSPGGDWLNQNFDKVENTLLRFTVALSAAMDPEAYRQEYLKKLYKLLEPTAVETKNPDTIKYFADYVAGKTPKAALRSFVKQAQLERKIARDPTGGQPYWWRVDRDGRGAANGASIEVVATNKQEALERASDEWDIRLGALANAAAYPVRPYSDAPVRAAVGEPQAIGQRSGATVGGRPSNPEGNWILAPQGENPPVPLFRFNAAGVDDANTVTAQWSREHPGTNAVVHYDPQQRYGQPPVPGSTTDLQRQRAAAAQQSAGDNWSADFERRVQQPVPGSTIDLQRQRAAQAQAQMDAGPEYRIRNMNDRSILTGFRAANQQAAEQEAERILRDLNLDPDHYDVIPLYAPRQADPYQSVPIPGVTDVELDIPTAPLGGQNFPRDTTQQPATRSMVPGREHIGWKVLLPSGEEVYQFSGAGNSQSDANRIAAAWLRDNGYGVSGEGYEVVPMWREI